MSKFRKLFVGLIVGASALVGLAGDAALAQTRKQFTYSERANARLAEKLGIPIYYALPTSTRAPLGQEAFPTTDILLDFKHPDAMKSDSDAGLRLVVTPRSGMARRLAKSEIFKTGDLLLTFRAEWGGAGAYPNVQMGISHAGLAYIQDGKLKNLDMPLNEEYLGRGMSGELTSDHYQTLDYLHVVRPRGLTDSDRANIVSWATLLNKNARKIYPDKIKFNDDYNAPKYTRGRPLDFVKTVGKLALGQDTSGVLDVYCSEFAWAVLALRRCDPATTADDFKGSRVPSCIEPAMTPLKATGNNVPGRGRRTTIGLADGPMTVIDGLKSPLDERRALLERVFVEDPAGLKKMSEGHRKVAEAMQPKFEQLKDYYLGSSGGGITKRLKARLIRFMFNRAVPENYSPTSYLLNTMLDPDNTNRSMDYVATIVIE